MVSGGPWEQTVNPGISGLIALTALLGGWVGGQGAHHNGVTFTDERWLWCLGGALGGVMAGLLGVASYRAGVTVGAAWPAVWLGSALLTGRYAANWDLGGRRARLSFALKCWLAPLTSGLGLIAALLWRLTGRRLRFRYGSLFVEAGRGPCALTLGAVVWAQTGCFAGEEVAEKLARHEALHTRQAATLGEVGFYLSYVTIGALWGVLQGGYWNGLNRAGRGNPFEKTAYTHTRPSRASACAAGRL